MRQLQGSWQLAGHSECLNPGLGSLQGYLCENEGGMYSSHMELDRDLDNGEGLWFHRASSLITGKVPGFCSIVEKENIFIYFNITLALSDDS